MTLKTYAVLPLLISSGLLAQELPSPLSAATALPSSTAPAAPAGGKPATPAAPAPSTPAAPGVPGTAGNYSSTTAEGGADRLFDVKSDSVDVESGTFQWKGKTFNLGDARAVRARFERYLATPPPEEDFDAYIKLLDKIEAKIASTTFSDPDAKRVKNLQEAWNLLFEASKSEYDGNASLVLANQVMKSWRERNELDSFRISIEQQKQLQREQEAALDRHADAIAARQAGKTVGTRPLKGKGGDSFNQPPEDESGKHKMRTLEENSSTTKADIVKNSAQSGLIGVQSKLAFQSTIVSFLLERRFRHSTLANGFYRQIYKSSQQKIEVGEKELKEFFPLSNFVPSLETLDSVARSAIGDVKNGLRSFNKLDSSSERSAAFERMQEAFILGEYEPDVIRMDYDTKHAYLQYARDLRDLQKFGDERDLGAAEELVTQIASFAKDFPAARIRSKIGTAKEASDMEVMAAKQIALVQGKDGAAEIRETIGRAAKIWPRNPSIKSFMKEMTGRADIITQIVPEFDKLIAAGNSRELFERKEQFAVALLQDKPRLEKLNEVLKKVGSIELILGQADALTSQGNRYLAWDAVMEAEKLDPSDPKVGVFKSKLSPQVADYAKLIADATRAEAEGYPGTAMAGYLAAQDLNRASKHCQDALDRIAKAALGSLPDSHS